MTTTAGSPPEIMTPEQAAGYLQVSRETIYRYIRHGKLMASKLGRRYRNPRVSVDLLPWAATEGQSFAPREFTAQEIDEFIRDDQLDEQARATVERCSAMMDLRAPRALDPEWPSSAMPRAHRSS